MSEKEANREAFKIDIKPIKRMNDKVSFKHNKTNDTT